MKNKKCNEKEICKKVTKHKNYLKDVATGGKENNLPKKLAPDVFVNETIEFLKNIKRDYIHFINLSKCCIVEQQEKYRQNEQELAKLRNKFNIIQVEDAEIKRKRWCRHCEAEAVFISSTGSNFYCSTECEQYQINLLE